MPKIEYKSFRFQERSRKIIEQANQILEEYESQGFVITLRQLYYQFVSRGLMENKQKNYKQLGSIINDARLAGLVDWSLMEDRTCNLQKLSVWNDPAQIITAVSEQFRLDLWKDQFNYVEVWIEKDALVGVIEGTCNSYRVPFFSCRGFTSQSEMWSAAQRIIEQQQYGHKVNIFHLGDHDPSGIDMSRDIKERLQMFNVDPELFEFKRLALNMPQVRTYNPPPNPAKTTDSRFEGYESIHGKESWELDALEPRVIARLILSAINSRLDPIKWKNAKKKEDEARRQIATVANRWDEVTEHLEDHP
jgi:hypothetical protein